jgi:hypothetical protein
MRRAPRVGQLSRSTSQPGAESKQCSSTEPVFFKTFMELRNRFQEMNSASLCRLAGRYDNPIHNRFLVPIDCFKIPAQLVETWYLCTIASIDNIRVSYIEFILHKRKRARWWSVSEKQLSVWSWAYQLIEAGRRERARENFRIKKHIVREVDLVLLCFCVYCETTFNPHLLPLDNTFNTVAIRL